MERIQFGGRPSPGFGVGLAPQSTFAKPSAGSSFFVMPTGKVGAFVGGALMSAVAGAVGTGLFGDGSSISLGSVTSRLQRNWRVLAATAVAGGVVGAIVK